MLDEMYHETIRLAKRKYEVTQTTTTLEKALDRIIRISAGF